MKKALPIISFISIFIICFVYFLMRKIPLEINYVKYNIACTIVPLGISDIPENHCKYKIRNYEYLRMLFKFKFLKRVEEITIDSQPLEFDILLGDGIPELKPKQYLKGKNENYQLEKIKLTDRFLNVRYVIKFSPNKKNLYLVLGANNELIMVNNEFCSISESEYKKLLLFFSKIVGDTINEY